MPDGANGGAKQIRGAQLTITLDYETHGITLAGMIANTLEGLAMLEMARLEMEYRWRSQRAAEELAQPGADFTGFLRGGLPRR